MNNSHEQRSISSNARSAADALPPARRLTGLPMLYTQTAAMFLDAYRELNSKKLFWITLALSALVALAMGTLGINEKGITFLHWELDSFISTAVMTKEAFYRFLFATFGVPIWLTWAATILALVSTSAIIPDFIASGSIELTLSRPISRLRLLLTKFLTGMLFATAQVLLFAGIWFLIVGFRVGVWDWPLFLAVPIVVVFFSYLFSMSVLLGLLTRSTIASLLLTLLFWLFLFGFNAFDGIAIQLREGANLRVQRLEARADVQERAARTEIAEAGQPVPETTQGVAEVDSSLRRTLERLEEERPIQQRWNRISNIVFISKTALPKTSETIGLLSRHLIKPEDAELFATGGGGGGGGTSGRSRTPENTGDTVSMTNPDREYTRRVMEASNERTLGWILGTSLGFVAFILLISGWIFGRRDF